MLCIFLNYYRTLLQVYICNHYLMLNFTKCFPTSCASNYRENFIYSYSYCKFLKSCWMQHKKYKSFMAGNWKMFSRGTKQFSKTILFLLLLHLLTTHFFCVSSTFQGFEIPSRRMQNTPNTVVFIMYMHTQFSIRSNK